LLYALSNGNGERGQFLMRLWTNTGDWLKGKKGGDLAGVRRSGFVGD